MGTQINTNNANSPLGGKSTSAQSSEIGSASTASIAVTKTNIEAVKAKIETPIEDEKPINKFKNRVEAATVPSASGNEESTEEQEAAAMLKSIDTDANGEYWNDEIAAYFTNNANAAKVSKQALATMQEQNFWAVEIAEIASKVDLDGDGKAMTSLPGRGSPMATYKRPAINP